MRKVVLTFEENQLPYVHYENGDVQSSFYTHHDALLQTFISSVFQPKEEEQVAFISPVLPEHTVKYAQKGEDTIYIFMTFPEQSFDVKYHKSVFQQVPFPKMVFGFKTINNNLIASYVSCYKDRFLRDRTLLYRFPYSNVWESTQLCYYNAFDLPDLVALQNFPYQWIETKNNDHLYDMERCNALQKPLREVFETTQGQSFNYDMLKPLNLTFLEWINSILSK